MKINKTALNEAVASNIITNEQATLLFDFLKSNSANSSSLTFTNVIYYLGGMIAIGAMTLFMGLGWESFGGAGILFIALIYAFIGLKLANNFANKKLAIPAGICATFVVVLTPLAIYGLQNWTGLWPDDSTYREYHRYIDWHWLYMELGTIAVGAIMLWKYRYPFLVMPVAVTMWYLTMDISAVLAGGDHSWEVRKVVSLCSGLFMIGIALWIDIRSRHSYDYAYWIYIFGVIAFWGGLSFQSSDSELSKFLYLCINLIMIGVGVILIRRVFVIFGALGCCAYIGHLAYDLFELSLLFPFILTAIGLAIIYLGVLWQKHEKKIAKRAREYLPRVVREFLESKM